MQRRSDERVRALLDTLLEGRSAPDLAAGRRPVSVFRSAAVTRWSCCG
ncbi:hypothetical protein NKH18_43185 [Streptomyces sp. M10(2022)]